MSIKFPVKYGDREYIDAKGKRVAAPFDEYHQSVWMVTDEDFRALVRAANKGAKKV